MLKQFWSRVQGLADRCSPSGLKPEDRADVNRACPCTARRWLCHRLLGSSADFVRDGSVARDPLRTWGVHCSSRGSERPAARRSFCLADTLSMLFAAHTSAAPSRSAATAPSSAIFMAKASRRSPAGTDRAVPQHEAEIEPKPLARVPEQFHQIFQTTVRTTH